MTTGTEVAVRRPQGQAAAIPAKLAYARALADSGLLPAAYRRNPANVLWAVEYGEMLGLPPMAAMTGVHVIEGKPTASAGLISGLVRQAGHKLRVWGTNKSATCEIVRSDDPEHTFSVTWTLKRNADDHPSAEEAGLLGKSVWKQYPASMLKSRAITQCARDACEEILYGLHYTPEELGAEVDEDGVVVAEVVSEPAQQPAERSACTPQDDQWYVHPEPEVTTDPEWLAATLRVIPEIGLDACRKLWPEVVGKVRAGEVSKPDGTQVLGVLQARMEELANPPQAAAEAPAETRDAPPAAAVLDPEDPWAPAIAGLASAADGEILLEDLIDQRGRGEIEPERAALIERAIETAIADLGEAESGMSELTARDHALRIATLEALADAVAAEYAKARAEAEPVFASKYADDGNDRQAVLLPSGEKVGQLTIKAPPPVVDMPPDALLDWCGEHFPAAVEEYIDPAKVSSTDVIAAVRDKLPDCIKTRVRRATAKALTEEIVKGKGLLADRRTGEAEAVATVTAGKPTGAFAFTGANSGERRQRLMAALLAGELRGVVGFGPLALPAGGDGDE